MKKLVVYAGFFLLSANSLIAQSGFFDAYDYNRWLSEFSFRFGPTDQVGEFFFNNQVHEIQAATPQLVRQGNWALSGSYVGRHDYFLVVLGGSIVQSLDSGDKLYIESSIKRADAAVGLMPIWDGFYVVVGGRLYDARVFVAESENCDVPIDEGGKQWLNIFAGLHLEWRIFDWLAVRFYGDAGGTRIGATPSWNTRATLRWQFGGLALHAGYRFEQIDHQSGEELLFKANIVAQGPTCGLSYFF